MDFAVSELVDTAQEKANEPATGPSQMKEKIRLFENCSSQFETMSNTLQSYRNELRERIRRANTHIAKNNFKGLNNLTAEDVDNQREMLYNHGLKLYQAKQDFISSLKKGEPRTLEEVAKQIKAIEDNLAAFIGDV